jgi:hypothetical protein
MSMELVKFLKTREREKEKEEKVVEVVVKDTAVYI